MQGCCAECGLEFEWWWMFRAQFHPWLFEHQWRKRPVHSSLRTLCAVPRAGCVCRELSLIHPIRIVPLIALLLGVLSLVMTLRISGLAYVAHYNAANFWMAGGAITPIGSIPHEIGYALREFARFVLPALVLPPLAFMLIPVSLQRVRVRPAHIVRMWIYSLIGVAVFALLIAFIQVQVNIIFKADWYTVIHPLDWRLIRWSPESSVSAMVIAEHVRPAWLLAMLWTWWWWRIACRDYLRLPDARLTSTLLMIMVALASFLVPHAVALLTELS